MIIEDDFMKELREEYEGLGLNDSQILSAKSLGITKEQIIILKKNINTLAIDLTRVWAEIVKAFAPIVKNAAGINELLDKVNDSQVEFIAKPIKHKKGKKLKCWENKRFYQ
ncbi:hypothetical protein LGL08_20035 [Clostridium estertheticum]|uniref:hypothetical protein n=1 Tax=Clostridium estertheticum TaxID=238834 RepID=UPI001CF29AFC|nr:hypothetical protein [Clostridium estertheticum]MCB2308995.1 hypothetical protein [Clostridium estertheticum]MCB2346871.1 hypothetical protein [Clostridium estertheticum]MCB2351817.1 hypothetical protein [Clostridium estertheticum]WAG48421.1 hypothetical protein LL127_22840 [Clostridium estertheticum]